MRKPRGHTPPAEQPGSGEALAIGPETTHRAPSRVSVARMLLALVVATALAGCPSRSSAPAAWPAFPASPAEVEALATKATRRPPATEVDAAPEAVLRDAEALGWTSLPSGDAVVASLQAFVDEAQAAKRPAFLLVGTFHDSSPQVDAFRRLVGPTGLARLTHVGLEVFTGDGAWGGVPLDQQRGDTARLEAFAKTGARQELDALARTLPEHDYTGWKYGAQETELALVAQARGLGLPVVGCDLPEALRVRAGGGDASTLRELHCAQVLAGLGGTARVALLYGLDHVRAGGLPRFLPRNAAVLSVQLVGGRRSPEAPESKLGASLGLTAPVLVPRSPSTAALLMPDRFTAFDVDRVRTTEKRAAPSGSRVVVVADRHATFSIGRHTLDVGPTAAVLELPPGAYTFVFREDSGVRVVGNVELEREEDVRLELDFERRGLSILEVRPER